MIKNIITITFGVFISINLYASSSNNNFDGSYRIPYSDMLCGNLGYSFKLSHQKDGYSTTSKMYKSNCRKNSSGLLEGYIYPKVKPTLRIFWIQTKNGVYYKD